MESSETLTLKTKIESVMKNMIDDTNKLLKEHGLETVAASIEVKFDLTEEQISKLPIEVQKKLTTPNYYPLSCYKNQNDGHTYCTW